MAAANSINEATTGIAGFTGTAFTATPVTQYQVQIGGATSSTLAGVTNGTTGQVLTANTGAAPTWGASSGLSVGTKITTYDASDTWTKSTSPPSIYIEVIGFNSGGGGGSGRKGTSTASGGGQGGTGGGGWYYQGPESVFGATETVTIGGTSNGGAAQAGDLTDGNNGAAINQSAFGNMLGYLPTAPASGGTTTSAANGQAGRLITPYQSANAGISGGGLGNNTAGGNASVVAGSYFSGTGGGGGGGYDLVVERAGGTGATFFKFDASTTLIAGGTAGTESGTINGGNGNVPLSTGGMITGGTGGGGGGGPKAGTTVGNGGNGAIPGGGGGGGSGGISGTSSSGAGGTGARGRIIVIEHF